MKPSIFFLALTFAMIVASCGSEDSSPKPSVNNSKGTIRKQNTQDTSKEKDTANSNPMREFDANNVIRKKAFDDGIQVEWIAEGFPNNPLLKRGEVCLIDYRLGLTDGKIIDGNNRLELPFIPFMVGYNMQTPGWDLGLEKLKVGDFAKIQIPADLAFGKKGLASIVPPNATLWLYVKVISKVSPSYNQDGIKTWVFSQDPTAKLISNKNREIIYEASSSTPSKANVQNTFAKPMKLNYIPGQLNVIPGMRKVLESAKVKDKIFALFEPNQAYGKEGFGNLVKPNERVFYNITVQSIREF